VQETLLSKSAHLVLGKVTLPWDVAYQAASNYISHATTCCRAIGVGSRANEPARITKRGLRLAVQSLLSFRRVPLGGSNELLANLWMFRNRLATLGHDKVYGLMGLMHSSEFKLQVDYRKPFSQVCREVVVDDIKLSGNLHALRGVRAAPPTSVVREGTRSDLPHPSTWSTDWDDLDYWAEDQPRILTEIYKQIYSASGRHKPRIATPIDPSKDLGSLYVSGKVFDSVHHTSNMLGDVLDSRPMIADSADLRSTIDVFRNRYKDSPYIAGGSAFSAILRTLLGDCYLPHYESQNLFHSLGSSKDGTCELAIRRITAADLIPALLWWTCRIKYLKGTLREEVRKLETIPAVMNVHASVIRATSGRRMFITSRGYIGLGPEHTQVGDQVAVLPGGSTPFMLRKAVSAKAGTTHWNLLGDCYVHGCMDGELVEGEQTDDWPMLELR
jgi:hypothetical protein